MSNEAHPPAPPDKSAEWRPLYNPWLIAFSVMLGTFMEVLDTSVANVSLPHIAGTLSATPDEATWVLTSYLVSNAIILPAAAWMGAVFGRKRFLLTCILIFTASSAICGAAPSLNVLILARVLQGLGGGALQPIAQSILLESFPPSRRGVAMATYGMGVVVAPILGPTLGGWITETYTWRWVFYINLPVGALAFLMIQAFVEDPPYVKNRRPGRIDYIGFALMAIGLATLQILLDKGQEDDWFSATWVRCFTAIAIVSLILFIVRQLQIEYPIVDLRILTNRNFAVGTALITVMGLVLYSTIAMLPLYLQTVMGYSALMSGLTITPRGFGAFLSNLVVGRVIAFVDTRVLIAAGLTVLGLSGLMFSHMNLDISMPNIVWPNFLNGVGAALVFASLATTTMGRLKNEQMGNAAGIFNLMRNIGGSIGIAAVTTFLARWSQVHQGILISHLTPYDPAYQGWLATTRGALITKTGALDADAKSLGLLYGVLGQQARLMAFMDIFQVTSILVLLAVPLVLLFNKIPTRKAPSGD